MNWVEKYLKKQNRLEKAIGKVQAKLNYFSNLAEQNVRIPEMENWNNWHDLKDRLIGRLEDNNRAYYAEHWEKMGYNAY